MGGHSMPSPGFPNRQSWLSGKSRHAVEQPPNKPTSCFVLNGSPTKNWYLPVALASSSPIPPLPELGVPVVKVDELKDEP